jgi:hypothetical protein
VHIYKGWRRGSDQTASTHDPHSGSNQPKPHPHFPLLPSSRLSPPSPQLRSSQPLPNPPTPRRAPHQTLTPAPSIAFSPPMGGPPAPARATSSRSSAPARRSARHGPPSGGDHQPPSPPSSKTAAVDSPGATEPRRLVPIRLRTRVHRLPSAAPSASRIRRESPAAPRRRTVQECAEEWGKSKAASGAPEEDCVLPFLQKGAPRKVRTRPATGLQLQLTNDSPALRFAHSRF